MKGALVEFTSAFGASVPNVIVFQFNPETLSHTWTQAETSTEGGNPLAVQGLPGETFGFTLAMDITDQLADPNPLSPGAIAAQVAGLYSRLAALEMLMFPVPSTTELTNTADTAGASDAAGTTGEQRETPAAQLPAVLFVWGAGRIVPVRVTSLTITEKLFDKSLNPTHADAQIELRVLTPTELDSVTGPLKQLAKAAYHYSQGKRELLALVNLGNAVGSFDLPPILGV